MRTREMKYSDYNITREESRLIQALCKLDNEQIRGMLHKAAQETNSGLAEYIIKSLKDGLSYTRQGDVPALQNDFYAYRLKCVVQIRDMLIACAASERSKRRKTSSKKEA